MSTSGMMITTCCLTVIFTLFTASQATYFQGGADLVSASCLGCICEAATGCDLQFNCTRGLCGPLLLSEKYWEDAGRCTIAGDNPSWTGAFFRCATDPWCAAWTVRNYVARFATDCNGDGRLGCTDFALLHYLGANNCGGATDRSVFFRAFRQCRAVTSMLNGK